MEILVVIISWLLFGGASSYFAKQRGRDPFAWFLIGMLLGILGLLLLFLLPPLSQTAEEEAPKELVLAKNEDDAFRLKSWYYLDDQRQPIGPASFGQLKKAEEHGKINSETLLWCEGMSDWKPLSALPQIKEALS